MTESDPRAKWRQMPDAVLPDEFVEEVPTEPVPGAVLHVEHRSHQQQAAMGD